jgi:carbamate kinase
MRLVVALGGNALLRREQAPTAAHQLANIRRAAAQLARVASGHELVLTHGNGPQVGLLALQAAAWADAGGVAAYPLDVLGAQTDGMLGYLLEQEIANRLPPDHAVATLVTRVEVDTHDPAFGHPTKPIGPVYGAAEAQRRATAGGWALIADGAGFRRAVASPKPLRVPGLPAIRCLLEQGTLVIAAGGGGIPVARAAGGTAHAPLHGVAAVIDKDLCASLLARELHAELLLIATDVDAVCLDWGLPTQRALGDVTPEQLARHAFAAGSMAPKVEAACAFVQATGGRAAIGSLDQIEALLAGRAGTQIRPARRAAPPADRPARRRAALPGPGSP